MLYKKPKELKYTDLAIYIDKNAYREDLTEEEESRIYEYLYLLASMLTNNAGFFRRSEYCDDFAIYFATSMYLRLRNPKQYILNDETGEPKIEKIKSVLNYMKNVIYMRKVQFEQEFYSQAISPPVEDDEVEYDTQYTFADKLSESIDDITLKDFDLCLGDICKTAKAFLKQIPYKCNTVVWSNIYLSCLLTLLSNITLSKRTLCRLSELKKDIINRPRAWSNLYKSSPEHDVILYHLDEDMRDYIWVLVQEIKHLIAKDLSLVVRTYVPFNSSLNLIALADINLEEYTEYGD